jgi:SPP1 gp7 family putative phage head morphogenesis protein
LNEYLDSKEKDEKKNYLHSSEVGDLEKELADEIKKVFLSVFKTMKSNGLRQGIEKVIKLKGVHEDDIERFITYSMSEDAKSLMDPHIGCTCSECSSKSFTDDVQLSDFVEAHVILEFEKAWKEHEEYFVNLIISKYGEIGEKAFEEVSKAAGIDASFNFVHSGVKDDLANDAGLRVKGIEETTRKMLAKTLSEAYENGELTDSWLKRIGSVMDMPDWRSEMIARTEISFAFNKSKLAGYKESGVNQVKWIAIIDNRTCPVCSSRDGQIYDLDSVPAIPAHPRCRCTTVGQY